MTAPTPDAGPLERPASRLAPERILALTLLVLAPLVALWVFWQAQVAFFLLFAGILWAALLDVPARALHERAGLKHAHAAYIVIAVTLAIIVGLVYFAGAYVVQEGSALYAALQEQAQDVRDFLETVRGTDMSEGTPLDLLKEIGAMIGGGGDGSAFSFVSSFFGSLANAVIIFFIGAFLLIEPGLYKRGLVRLFPTHQRESVDTALHEAGSTLRSWLIGKLASMSIIFALTWLGLWFAGYPFSFALGLLAGALAFIPNVGPILTYIPIALVGLSQGITTMALGAGIYLVAQSLESYVVTPLIQKHMVSLPPALIFFAQVIGGILFGLWGVALATPLAAILRLWIARHYVEETIES